MIDVVPDYPRAGHRAAVLGHPIRHSLSPVLHQAAYRDLGLTDWHYRAVDVDSPDLARYLGEQQGQGWAGWSLTMPLKRVVRPLLVRQSPLAEAVGAVNTVLVAPDGLEGFNTDVHGIVGAFGEFGLAPTAQGGGPRRGVVLGGGATASSALAALADLGCQEPVVHVRSVTRAGDLAAAAERLGVKVTFAPFDSAAIARSVEEADLVVSTLPGGAADDLVADGVPDRAGPRRPVLLDVVYDPWPTPLAAAWRAAGAPAVGGFVMLLHQAFGQVHLMTGQPPPVAGMRAAGLAALVAREAPA